LWYNPGRKESLYIVPGALALVLWIFPALLSVLALVREKEQGTILQVYASNLTPAEFIGGKALAYLIVGLIEFTCLLAVAMTIFGLRPRAGIFIFMISTILYVGSGVLFGLAAGTKTNTQMAGVQIVANIGFLTTMLFSGFIYPLRNIVFPLSLLSYVVPAMYYILVCRNELVRGGDWIGLWYAPVFLFVFDAALLVAMSRMKMKLPG
jgi:ABC-2 type transport system permease protein